MVFEMLDKPEALDDNEFNGAAIYTIPPQDGANTEQDDNDEILIISIQKYYLLHAK